MSASFTTRAQAAAPPAELIERMASAAYERSRFPGCTRPPWEQLEPSYRAEARADQVAAIQAAEAQGYRFGKALADSRELAPGDQRTSRGEAQP